MSVAANMLAMQTAISSGRLKGGTGGARLASPEDELSEELSKIESEAMATLIRDAERSKREEAHELIKARKQEIKRQERLEKENDDFGSW